MRQLIICILLATPLQGFSQTSTLNYIETWITLCDSLVQPDIHKDLYVIDGVPYKGLDAVKVVSDLSASDRIRIDFLDPNVPGNWPFHHPPKGTIILIAQRDRQLKGKVIKRNLTKLRSLFEKPIYKQNQLGHPYRVNGSNNPALMINDSSVFHYDAWKVLNELKVREIEYIDFEKKVPILIYGEKAKNGLVRIWLKK